MFLKLVKCSGPQLLVWVRIPHLKLEINLGFLAFEDNLFVFLGEKKKDMMKVANESMLLLAKLSV